jgi:hypothetical protein
LLKQFVRVGLFKPKKIKRIFFLVIIVGCVVEKVTYDNVRFDKARDGVEDTFGAIRLLLAPERKTLGKIFVTR